MLTTYRYDRCNRLQTANAGGSITTYTYDAAGNLTTEATSSGGTLYTWDAAGRMMTADVTAGTVTFTYNADGQRTAKQSTDGSATGYLYDYKKLLAETDEVGGEVSNLYATTSDQEFGDLISEDDDQYTHQYEAQANTAALLDNTGTVQATYKYYAFGNVAAYSIEGDAWTSLTVDQWANMTVDQWAALPLELSTNMLAGGKKQYYLDSETELYLLGTGTNGRYYDASSGRFLSEDPIRQAGGDPNLYLYVRNNPINHLDPSGHDAQEDQKKKQEEINAQQRQKSSKHTAQEGQHPAGKTPAPSHPAQAAAMHHLPPANQAHADHKAASSPTHRQHPPQPPHERDGTNGWWNDDIRKTGISRNVYRQILNGVYNEWIEYYLRRGLKPQQILRDLQNNQFNIEEEARTKAYAADKNPISHAVLGALSWIGQHIPSSPSSGTPAARPMHGVAQPRQQQHVTPQASQGAGWLSHWAADWTEEDERETGVSHAQFEEKLKAARDQWRTFFAHHGVKADQMNRLLEQNSVNIKEQARIAASAGKTKYLRDLAQARAAAAAADKQRKFEQIMAQIHAQGKAMALRGVKDPTAMTPEQRQRILKLEEELAPPIPMPSIDPSETMDQPAADQTLQGRKDADRLHSGLTNHDDAQSKELFGRVDNNPSDILDLISNDQTLRLQKVGRFIGVNGIPYEYLNGKAYPVTRSDAITLTRQIDEWAAAQKAAGRMVDPGAIAGLKKNLHDRFLIHILSPGFDDSPEATAIINAEIKEALEKRRQEAIEAKSVGAPGPIEGAIPFWGSGRATVHDIQTGHYGWAAVNAALFVSDIFLAKDIATAGGKLIFGLGSRELGEAGLKEAGEELSKEVGEGPSKEIWRRAQGTRIQKTGGYFVKEVDPTASSFGRWWGLTSIEAQARALDALGPMAPRFYYKGGQLITEDIGSGAWRDWLSAYLRGSWKLGTPFTDILPKNMGTVGRVFDPVIHPLIQIEYDLAAYLGRTAILSQEIKARHLFPPNQDKHAT